LYPDLTIGWLIRFSQKPACPQMTAWWSFESLGNTHRHRLSWFPFLHLPQKWAICNGYSRKLGAK
jgi:hypothetical protein